MACAGNTSAKTRASDWRKSFVEPPVKTSKQIDADFHYINYTPENYVEMDKLPDSSIKTTHYRGGPPPGRSTYASGEPRPTLKQSPWWLTMWIMQREALARSHWYQDLSRMPCSLPRNHASFIPV